MTGAEFKELYRSKIDDIPPKLSYRQMVSHVLSISVEDIRNYELLPEIPKEVEAKVLEHKEKIMAFRDQSDASRRSIAAGLARINP
jgi:hypothetical protein